MSEHERPLHLFGGGEVHGPSAPVSEGPAPGQPPRLAYGSGGGSAAAASQAFGHFAEEPAASPAPARQPAAPPARRPAARQPPVRTLAATNIARRDNFSESVAAPHAASAGAAFEVVPQEPAPEGLGIDLAVATTPHFPAPRPPPRPAPSPAPSAAAPVVSPAPPRPRPGGPRTLAATNIARRDNFAESVAGPHANVPAGFEPAE